MCWMELMKIEMTSERKLSVDPAEVSMWRMYLVTGVWQRSWRLPSLVTSCLSSVTAHYAHHDLHTHGPLHLPMETGRSVANWTKLKSSFSISAIYERTGRELLQTHLKTETASIKHLGVLQIAPWEYHAPKFCPGFWTC